LDDELTGLTSGLTNESVTSLANMELKQIKAITSHLNNHIDETLQKISSPKVIDQSINYHLNRIWSDRPMW
jgi:hypothetical protein